MANINIIKSNSYRIINEEIKKITEGIQNITYFSLNDVTIYDVIDDASYFGLFDENRCIVVRDVKYFGGKFNYEEETNALKNFFKNIGDDLIIIFIVEQLNLKKSLTVDAVANGALIIDKSNVDDSEIDLLIKEYTSERGISIDKDALLLLKGNCLNNLDLIIQEIDKLSMLNMIINKQLIMDAGSVYIDYRVNGDEDNQDKSAFDFSNAVVAKKFDKSLEMLDKLLLKGVEIVKLVGLLSSSFCTMYMVKAAVQNNMSDEEIAKLYGFSNPKRVFVLKNNVKIYTLDELEGIILELAKLDIKIKTGYNPIYGIKEFLLNL